MKRNETTPTYKQQSTSLNSAPLVRMRDTSLALTGVFADDWIRYTYYDFLF